MQILSGKFQNFMRGPLASTEVKVDGCLVNLNKQHIYNSGVLWSFLGSSLVHPWSLARSIYIRYKGKES